MGLRARRQLVTKIASDCGQYLEDMNQNAVNPCMGWCFRHVTSKGFPEEVVIFAMGVLS